jgi:hypothetical protein
VAVLLVAEAELEVLGLEAAVVVGLLAQVAQQVELEPAHGGAHPCLLRRDRERALPVGERAAHDALRNRQVLSRDTALAGLLLQAAVRALEHVVRV